MKKKTVYIWMGTIVTLTTIVFAAIYFLGLQSELKKTAKIVERNGPPVFNFMINGDIDKSLDKPMDVAKIGSFIYVTDTNHKQVQVFDGAGSPIFQFGKEGSGKGEFKFPYGIAGDKKGNVYVADLYNGNISIFDEKGKFIKYFEEMDKKNKSIESPAGIRIIKEKLYVTDIKKSRLLVYDLKGKKLLELARAKNSKDLLNAPNAVTADKDGNIYVADSGNNRVVVYDKKGNFIRNVNGSKDGKGNSVFVNPRGIAVNSRGILYVVNNLTHFVYGFDEKGKEVFTFGGMGDGNEQFYLPNGLFIDKDDQVYITDTLNQRVAIYY
ncbi:DNA-binding beta-propeller fold protein YncE [Bacillus sp. SLBN-46]|uniref:6-bladed beta-propeller n=1 Tax=Bacillus sp. SLBN-46 TaxID=3042283 RepID=UPI00285E69EE|nr:6-bladed beta-propeller [Bacillus sp. SLBN-46]MDR6121605.1 DNA-binding beta-propeller fold protein YncE [Bacillus sp. SLBN-46]